MRIRKARKIDLGTIAEFNALLASETEGVDLDRVRLRSGVENMLRDESRGFYLLAEFEGVAVGQLGLTFEWSDWRNGMFWWLQSVYVKPEFRRQGILRALYARVLELASESGACGVRLYVEKDNRAAQSAYQKLGLASTVFEMYEDDFVIKRKSHRKPSD